MGFDTPVTARYGTKSMAFPLALSGKGPSGSILFVGELRTVTTGETTDYATDFAVYSQHICLNVTALTGSGSVVVTGTSLPEADGIPVTSDTETITVNATGRYQTDKKWWEVTNIDAIVSGITAITYDIEVCGYLDWGNESTSVIGFRLDGVMDGASPDLSLRIRKIQDDGSKKMTIVPMEDIGFDLGGGAAGIVDNLRTAGDDRSYTSATLIGGGGTDININLKALDYNTYFSSDENIIEGAKAEGIIIDLRGQPTSGGITTMDRITLILYYSQP